MFLPTVLDHFFHMHVVIGRPKHKYIWPFAHKLQSEYGAKIKFVRPLTAIHVGI